MLAAREIVPWPLRELQRARRMLKESRYTETIGRQLFAASGNLALCVGWFALDSVNVPLARRLSSQAQLLASDAGDAVLTAQACASAEGRQPSEGQPSKALCVKRGAEPAPVPVYADLAVPERLLPDRPV
jgi:hypothetical protein